MKSLYYPEVGGNYSTAKGAYFDNDYDAAEHYQKIYGNRLMAVIKDDNPNIDIVWQRN